MIPMTSTKQISIRVPIETFEWLKATADDIGGNPAMVARRILNKAREEVK